MQYEEYTKSRLSSAYVCVNPSQDLNTPQFGHLRKIFSHKFGDKSVLFVEADIFNETTFGTELNMWFTKSTTVATALFPIEEISQPLIVALEGKSSLVWYLNYGIANI